MAQERAVRQKTALSSAIKTTFSLDTVPVSKDALTASPVPTQVDYPQTLDALIDEGYRIIEWDGRYVGASEFRPLLDHKDRTPTPIVDSRGMIYVHLAGRPLSDDFTQVAQNAYDKMDDVAEALGFKYPTKETRRGPFVSLAVGVSSGNGNSVFSIKEITQTEC